MTTLRLNQSAVRHYHKEGYFLFKQPVFSPEKFGQLMTIFEDLVERRTSGTRTDELDNRWC